MGRQRCWLAVGDIGVDRIRGSGMIGLVLLLALSGEVGIVGLLMELGCVIEAAGLPAIFELSASVMFQGL